MLKILRLLTVLSLLLIISACGQNQPLPTVVPVATTAPATNTPEPTRTALPTATATQRIPQTNATDPAQQAYLRVVHAAPDLGSVDFYVDGLTFASFIEFGQYTQQSGIVAGDYTLRILPNGARDFAQKLIEQPISIKGGDTVTVVLTGVVGAPSVIIAREDPTPLNGKQTRLTLLNALPNKANVNLQDGSTVLIPDVAYATTSASITVPTAELALNIRSNGEIIYADTLKLRERQSYTLIVTSEVGDAAQSQVIALLAQVPGVGTVNAINVTSNLSVDIYANDQLIAQQVGYAYVTDSVQLRSQDYDLKIYASDADIKTVQPLITSQLSVGADSNITLILMGDANQLKLVTRRLDTSPIPSNKARISFVNTLPNVPRAQVQSVTDLSSKANYGQVTEIGEIPVGALPLTWYEINRGVETGQPLEDHPDFSVVAGTDYLYLFIGRSDLPPLVFSQSVETIIATPSPEELAARPTPEIAPTVHAINAIEGISVNILVDDVPIVSGLSARTSSNGTIIQAGEHVFTVSRDDTGELLARLISTVQFGKVYTAVAYGRVETGYQILLVEATEPTNSTNAPMLRLINLSENSTEMGVAIVASNGSTASFPIPNATPDPNSGGLSPNRVSLQIGLTRIVDKVLSLGSSPITPINTNGAGLKDVYVVDNVVSKVSVILPSVTFELGKQYDVIAFESPFSDQVTAYVVPYTKP